MEILVRASGLACLLALVFLFVYKSVAAADPLLDRLQGTFALPVALMLCCLWAAPRFRSGILDGVLMAAMTLVALAGLNEILIALGAVTPGRSVFNTGVNLFNFTLAIALTAAWFRLGAGAPGPRETIAAILLTVWIATFQRLEASSAITVYRWDNTLLFVPLGVLVAGWLGIGARERAFRRRGDLQTPARSETE